MGLPPASDGLKNAKDAKDAKNANPRRLALLAFLDPLENAVQIL